MLVAHNTLALENVGIDLERIKNVVLLLFLKIYIGSLLFLMSARMQKRLNGWKNYLLTSLNHPITK
jgi:hypothetical protein